MHPSQRHAHCATRPNLKWGALALALLLAGCAAGTGPATDSAAAARMARVKNVVVIYAENHSFDNLYGLFPGANGIANATRRADDPARP